MDGQMAVHIQFCMEIFKLCPDIVPLSIASYPCLPKFLNVHEKQWDGLVDCGDTVCDEGIGMNNH